MANWETGDYLIDHEGDVGIVTKVGSQYVTYEECGVSWSAGTGQAFTYKGRTGEWIRLSLLDLWMLGVVSDDTSGVSGDTVAISDTGVTDGN
jgi:hypothetical protein